VNCILENFFHLFVLTISLSVKGREAAQEEAKEGQEAIKEHSSSRRSKKMYLSLLSSSSSSSSCDSSSKSSSSSSSSSSCSSRRHRKKSGRFWREFERASRKESRKLHKLFPEEMEETRKQRKEAKKRRKEKPHPWKLSRKEKENCHASFKTTGEEEDDQEEVVLPKFPEKQDSSHTRKNRLISVLAATTWMMWRMRRKWRSKFSPLHIFIGTFY